MKDTMQESSAKRKHLDSVLGFLGETKTSHVLQLLLYNERV